MLMVVFYSCIALVGGVAVAVLAWNAIKVFEFFKFGPTTRRR